MPRTTRRAARCALGLAGACAVVLTLPATTADAAPLKRASATASAHATVSAARTATTTMSATAEATVPGTSQAPIRVTRSASATRTITSAASSAGRRTASARATTVAKAKAKARAKARSAARAQARSRAAALAAAAANARARAAAEAAARAAAWRAADAEARQQAAAAASPCSGATMAATDGRPMTCTFSDEFNGTTLDPTKWTPMTTATSGYRNNTDECFVDTPDTISVSNGTLKLSTVPAPNYPCSDHATNFLSGSVTSIDKFAQAYGTFSVRAKFPAATVAGLHSALWMWPANQAKYGSWPASGEIDIAEKYSAYPDRVIPYLHYDFDPASVTASYTNFTGSLTDGFGTTGTNVATNNFCVQQDPDAFHTYTMTWRPGQISITFDDKNCMTDNYAASDLPSGAPFDQPFFMTLTQALGAAGTANEPTAATPAPATTEVDYVRVWN